MTTFKTVLRIIAVGTKYTSKRLFPSILMIKLWVTFLINQFILSYFLVRISSFSSWNTAATSCVGKGFCHSLHSGKFATYWRCAGIPRSDDACSEESTTGTTNG